MTDNKNQLREDAIEFAIQISDLCDEIKGCSVYVNQIVRSSSSIGANIHEAKYAQSKADFINKLEISLKECSETEYWLELIFRKGKWARVHIRIYETNAVQSGADSSPPLPPQRKTVKDNRYF